MDINNNRHIVFCVEHYNPLGLVRSLGEAGIKPDIIVINSQRKLVTKSKYVKTVHTVESIEAGYRLLMTKYGSVSPKPFIYTADDKITSYLDEHFEELKDHFYFFNAGEKGRITYFMNKENINNLARKHGLNVLDTFVVERGNIPSEIEYPVITKSIASTVGGWKDDVFVCQNDNELKEAYKKIQSPIVLLQKYINKKNELCLDGISYNKGKGLFIAIASNYNYILNDTYSSYMTVKNFKDKELYDALASMIEESQFEGIFSIEFLIGQDGSLYFCEVNFRNSTWSYAATCAGMNLPYLWSYSMLNNKLPNGSLKQIKDGFTAIVDFEDYYTRVKKGNMSFFKWFGDYRKSNCKFYLGRNDIKPFISVFTSKLSRLLHR